MPTASPASATRNQRHREVGSVSGASARKVIAMAMVCAATPQAATEKKLELNTAASPPRTQAAGARPDTRKKYHADSPRMSGAQGRRIWKSASGFSSHCRPKVNAGRGGRLAVTERIEILPAADEPVRQAVGLGHQPDQRTGSLEASTCPGAYAPNVTDNTAHNNKTMRETGPTSPGGCC